MSIQYPVVNSFVTIGNMVFKHGTVIPIRIYHKPFWRSLFLYLSEKYKKWTVSCGSDKAQKYHEVLRFTDDPFSIINYLNSHLPVLRVIPKTWH